MDYISLKERLQQSPNLKPVNEERVDEFLMTLVAGSVLAYVCTPLLNTEFMKNVGGGIGAMFAGIGSLFGLGARSGEKNNSKDDKSDKDKKSKDEKDDKKPSSNDSSSNNSSDDVKKFSSMMQNMFDFCQKQVDKEKAGAEKDSIQAMLDKARAASVDEKGNPIGPDDFASNYEKVHGTKFDEDCKSVGLDPSKISKEQMEKIHEEAKKQMEGKTEEEREKIAKEGLESAKKAHEAAVKRHEEAEKMQKELDDLKAQKEQAEKNGDTKKANSLTDAINNKTNEIRDKLSGGLHSLADKLGTNKDEKTDNRSEPNKDEKWSDEDKQRAKDDLKKKKEELDATAKEAAKAGQDSGKTEAVQKLQKKIDDEVKSMEDAIERGDRVAYEKYSKSLDNLQKAQERQMGVDDRDEEKEFQITHNGKPDAIIRRKAKRGDGVVYCYKSDQDTTIAPKEAKAMLKKNGIKESISLSDWLTIMFD